MIIKRILNKVEISVSTYVIVLISFLAGYFEYVFIFMFVIIVHELGHYICGLILGLNVKRVSVLMFGGVTELEEDISVSINKEIFMIIAGPFVQFMLFLLVSYIYKCGYVSCVTYEKFCFVNYVLFSFNLLPILPLDGGKLFNNVLDKFFSYRLSHNVSIFVSFMFIPFLFIIDNKLLILFLVLFLLFKNIEEIKIHKYKVNKLILERKLGNYVFRKRRLIDNIYNIKRNENFYIVVNGVKLYEKEYFLVDTCIKNK